MAKAFVISEFVSLLVGVKISAFFKLEFDLKPGLAECVLFFSKDDIDMADAEGVLLWDLGPGRLEEIGR